MNEPVENRLALILGVEHFALYARYAVFLVLAPLSLLHLGPAELGGIILIGCLIGLHNLFVHWVFRARRHHLFASRWNLAVYLVEFSTIVALTGADTSDGYLLYLLLLIGFSAYVRNLEKTMLVAALCCAAYGAIIAAVWYAGVEHETNDHIVARFSGIIITGWLVGTLSQVLDRTEQDSRAATQALAASQTTLRTILDNTADPIIVFDDNEFITDANDRASDFLGMPRNQLLRLRFRSFVFDDGTFPGKMTRLRATGEYHGDQILINAEGEERTVDFRVRSFIRNDRQFFVVVAHDITEQKDLQEATRLANVDLERLNRELRHVDQLKTGFLTSMSQKLRSPMSAILGYVEMLLEEELGEVTPEQRKALRTCRRSALRILRLVDEALDLGGPDIHRPRRENPPRPSESDTREK